MAAERIDLEALDLLAHRLEDDRVRDGGPGGLLLHDHLQVDLRVVQKESYGAALQYFTGSKEHNVSMRSLAIKKGFKLNEYGIFEKKSETYVAGTTEEGIYKTLNLEFIEPDILPENILLTSPIASGPEILIIEIAPSPYGVDIAQIVSFIIYIISFNFLYLLL